MHAVVPRRVHALVPGCHWIRLPAQVARRMHGMRFPDPLGHTIVLLPSLHMWKRINA